MREKLEKQIADTEKRIGELEAALAENARLQEEAAGDFTRVGELFAASHQMEAELEKLYAVLEELG